MELKKGMQKGSYTIEASIWISSILFMMMGVLELGIDFYQRSKEREPSAYLQELDIVEEFYNYQVLKEVGEEWLDD